MQLNNGDKIAFKTSPTFTATVTEKDGVLGFCSPFSGIWRPLAQYDLSKWRKI